MYPNKRISFLLLFFLGTASALAASTDQQLGKGPIQVLADHLVAQNKPKQQAIYSGNVVMKQGDLVIYAADLTIHGDNGKVQEAVATGSPVRFTMSSAMRHGYGNTLTYEPGSGRIVLQGDAHLWQGKDEVSGNEVIYLLQSQQTQVTAQPGQRVRSVFYPSKEQKKP
ncbi:MAG: lipopolysaccharide transport periplasmic protein LptA [Acidithiobacillus sp.]|nr:lipopolysaccharide transport periplasmic protein LptA [Acidithiobacillus sp.]